MSDSEYNKYERAFFSGLRNHFPLWARPVMSDKNARSAITAELREVFLPLVNELIELREEKISLERKLKIARGEATVGEYVADIIEFMRKSKDDWKKLPVWIQEKLGYIKKDKTE